MAINVNGYAHSHASVKLKADGLDIEDLDAVEYANSIERGEQRGVGIQRRAMTRGQAKAEAKLTFSSLDAYMAFVKRLGAGYMERAFDIVVTYGEAGAATYTDRVVGCRLKKPSRKSSQGTEAHKVECDLDCMYIIEDGVDPFLGMVKG